MQDVIIYLLKSSGLLLTFFLAYHFLLRKETFFTSNRWFLLLGVVTSTLLPLFFIKKTVYIERHKLSIEDIIAMANHSITAPSKGIPLEESIDWLELALIGYSIVTIVFITKIIVNLFSVINLLKNKTVYKEGTFSLIDLNEKIIPFSFFNYIVYNSNLYNPDELKNIIHHEKIHSKQKHSIDVIVANLFSAVFWINPIVWLYKKAIIQNLEFIADHNAIQNITDVKAYQKTLLKVVSHQSCLPITNHFYQSLIKKRIVMLNKNQSHNRNSWKYAVVIPALIAFVFLFQIKVVAQEKEINHSIVDLTWTKNSSDQEFKEDAKNARKQVIFNFDKIIRNDKNEITSITISYKDKLGNNNTTTFENKNGINAIHFIRDIDENGKGKIGYIGMTDNTNDATTIKPEIKTVFKDIKINNSKDDDVKATQNSIIIINGQKYDDAALQKLDPNFIEKMDVITDQEVVKKYNEKDKKSVILITTKTINDSENITVKDNPIIFSNDNGDDIVITDNYRIFKVPGSPAAIFSENSPILIVNGVPQNNPKATLEIMDVKKIKSVRIYDENDQESKGTQIKKVVITTK